MTWGEAAGESARAEAERLRARARRLEQVADRWEQGAAGEVRTAALLAALDRAWFTVFHDVRVPGSRANVDHVVLGPTGLFVIDSKQFTGRVTLGKGTLWSGRFSQGKALATARWEAEQVVEALRVDGEVPEPRVVVCIHGAALAFDVADVDGVTVVAPHALLPQLIDRPQMLGSAACTRLAESVRSRLGGVAVASARAAARAVVPSPSPSPARRRRPPGRGRRSSPRQEGLLGAIAAAVALLVVVPKVLDNLVPRGSSGATPTTAAAAPLAPPAVTGGYSCPQPGAGWRFDLAWPGSGPDVAGYLVDWRSGGGAWTSTLAWRDPAAPWVVRGLDAGQPLVVRARAVTDAGVGPWGEAAFTAPAHRC